MEASSYLSNHLASCLLPNQFCLPFWRASNALVFKGILDLGNFVTSSYNLNTFTEFGSTVSQKWKRQGKTLVEHFLPPLSISDHLLNPVNLIVTISRLENNSVMTDLQFRAYWTILESPPFEVSFNVLDETAQRGNHFHCALQNNHVKIGPEHHPRSVSPFMTLDKDLLQQVSYYKNGLHLLNWELKVYNFDHYLQRYKKYFREEKCGTCDMQGPCNVTCSAAREKLIQERTTLSDPKIPI